MEITSLFKGSVDGRNERLEIRLRDQSLYGAKIFLLVFIPYFIFQTLGIVLYRGDNAIDPETAFQSILINALLIVVFGAFLGLNHLAHRRGRSTTGFFYPSLILTVSAALTVWILHLHFAGSQSSLLPILIVCTMLVCFWFFEWKTSLILFSAANVGIFILVALEYRGILPYAPIFPNGDEMGQIFLDRRVIALNAAIYVTAIAINLSIIAHIRRFLERSNSNLVEANRTLQIQITERKRVEEERERLVLELREALDKVKTLSGLIPICSYCKKIRDDKGYWHQLELYVSEHSNAEFSHGICLDCSRKFYPDANKESYPDDHEDEG